VSPQSIRVGLIGSTIGASLTPAMHMQEGRSQGLDYEYRSFDLDDVPEGAAALPRLLDEAEQAGFQGLNITHPCKQTVIPLLDRLDSDVQTIGACNTVLFRDGSRLGCNTDWWGYREAFKRDFPGVPTERVLQIGVGGAGSAVAYALLDLGVSHLILTDIARGRAETLAARYGSIFGADRISVVDAASPAVPAVDGVVQTSPVGSLGHPGLPFDPSGLRPGQWVSDVIYFPRQTALIEAALSQGLVAASGGGMAVFQAVRAFELFSGRRADAARMARHFAQLAGRGDE